MRSIYIGGGTPSLASASWLAELLDCCRDEFAWERDIEVSLEANPGTVDERSMRQWRQAGINRVSFGVQSLNDEVLRTIGRIHNRQEALQSVRQAKEVGFDNVSLDLICGLPGQDEEIWRATLSEALALGPQHMSVYALSVETGTPLARALDEGRCSLPTDEVQEALEAGLRELLAERGFEHYEISNWCRPSFRCRHNEIYWRNEEYLGLGCGAVSYLRGWRFTRVRSPREYIELSEAGLSTLAGGERLGREAHFKETLMLGLRTKEGADIAALSREFGADAEAIWAVCERWPAELWSRQGDRLALTERGWDVSNELYLRLWEAWLGGV